LTEAMRRRPYSVVLLDEVEKAHPDVFNVLLQVFDDGRLTDGHGRTVNFANTVLIMTSNIGSDEIQKMAREEHEAIKHAVQQQLSEHFRPEFLNRIDETVVFRVLSREQIQAIVHVQLQALRQRLAEQELLLEVTEGAEEFLGNIGYDPEYGARPLRRALRIYLENPLAQALLEGQFAPGQTVQVDRSGEGLGFSQK